MIKTGREATGASSIQPFSQREGERGMRGGERLSIRGRLPFESCELGNLWSG